MSMAQMDPEKMAQVREKAKGINAEIRILHKEYEIRLKFVPTTPEATAFVVGFLPKFADTMAAQLGAFFEIKGEIIDVGKD